MTVRRLRRILRGKAYMMAEGFPSMNDLPPALLAGYRAKGVTAKQENTNQYPPPATAKSFSSRQSTETKHHSPFDYVEATVATTALRGTNTAESSTREPRRLVTRRLIYAGERSNLVRDWEK